MEFDSEYERYEYLQRYFMDFSLKGQSWYNKLAEYFSTIRIHIGKLNTFKPVLESYDIKYWINEICGDIRTAIASKDSTWKTDPKVLDNYASEFINNFNNITVLNAILRTQYDGLRLTLIKNYNKSNLNDKKFLMNVIESNSDLCDDVFINCIKIMSSVLSDKKNCSKNKSPDFLMNLMKSNLETELERLVK